MALNELSMQQTLVITNGSSHCSREHLAKPCLQPRGEGPYHGAMPVPRMLAAGS